jgi:hypothetical protein
LQRQIPFSIIVFLPRAERSRLLDSFSGDMLSTFSHDLGAVNSPSAYPCGCWRSCESCLSTRKYEFKSQLCILFSYFEWCGSVLAGRAEQRTERGTVSERSSRNPALLRPFARLFNVYRCWRTSLNVSLPLDISRRKNSKTKEFSSVKNIPIYILLAT